MNSTVLPTMATQSVELIAPGDMTYTPHGQWAMCVANVPGYKHGIYREPRRIITRIIDGRLKTITFMPHATLNVAAAW